jgi:hypothetical protein
MTLPLLYRFLIFRALQTITTICLRCLCIFQGLNWFYTCPTVVIDDEEITMFSLFGKILSTVSPIPIT